MNYTYLQKPRRKEASARAVAKNIRSLDGIKVTECFSGYFDLISTFAEALPLARQR